MLSIDEADRLVDLGFQETRLGQLLCSSKPESLGVDTPQQQQQQQQHSGGPLKQSYLVKPPSPLAAVAAAGAAAAGAGVGVGVLLQRQHRAVVLAEAAGTAAAIRHDTRAAAAAASAAAAAVAATVAKQQKRLDTFQDFVSRSSPCCLISTDLAARGIDFVQQQRGDGMQVYHEGGAPGPKEDEGLSAVDLVVQFDCPDSTETHVHRVGRTARFTRKGQAVLLLLPSEIEFIGELQSRGVRHSDSSSSSLHSPIHVV
ncbi:hypothetical protein Emag_006027 [Eimeria magna]